MKFVDIAYVPFLRYKKYLILIFSTVRLSVLKILSPQTFFAQKIINKF